MRKWHYASVTGKLTVLFEEATGKTYTANFVKKPDFVTDNAAAKEALAVMKKQNQPLTSKCF